MSQTVLVADDSQTIRKIVEMALKGSTYQVVGVGSAQDAMEAAHQSPSVILLDYYMPDGSGYEVCRALKNNPGTREIPVIMLGGNYKQFDENLARQSGADGIVMKPFKTDALLNAISAVRAGASAPPAQPVSSFQQPPTPAPAPYTPPQPSYQQPPTPAPAPYTPPQPSYQQPAPPQPSYQQPPTPAPPQPSYQQPATTPAPQSAFGSPYQQSPTPAPTPAPSFQQPAASSSPFQQAAQPYKSPEPAEPPVLSMDSDPSEVDERPAPAHTPAPTPFPSQASAGSQPRIATPDVNASSRQPAPQPAATPAPTAGSGSMNVGLSRSEIEKMIREEVRSVVKQELPGMLRTVMGETFQTKVLPRLVQHTDERIEKIVSERIATAIRDNVRVELEKLLSEE